MSTNLYDGNELFNKRTSIDFLRSYARSYHVTSMTEEGNVPKGYKYCECGCGELIEAYDSRNRRQRRFKRGHCIRLKENRTKLNDKLPRGENHYEWKGGRTKLKGYVMIQAKWHPRATKGGICVRTRFNHRVHVGSISETS